MKKYLVRTINTPVLYYGYIGNNQMGWLKKEDSECAYIFDCPKNQIPEQVNEFEHNLGGKMYEIVRVYNCE